MKQIPIEGRFAAKVRKVESGCHEWTGHIMPNGYGQVSYKQKPHYAHRVAWELANGPILDGLYVLHTCDNRKCVNPEHLFLGTFNDNMADMVSKQRQASGNRSGRRKLNSDQARAIRSEIGTQVEIGKRYGVTASIVSMIRSGRIWRNI
jgi:hypothetical protein